MDITVIITSVVTAVIGFLFGIFSSGRLKKTKKDIENDKKGDKK